MMISHPVGLPKAVLAPRTADAQGHLRLRPAVGNQPHSRVRPAKSDDAEGSTRLGYLDADHPVEKAPPEHPASLGGDAEGQLT